MKKVSGLVTFFGCAIGALFSLYLCFENNQPIAIICAILFSFGIHYTIITGAVFKRVSILDSLDLELQIIKRKIEKRELLSKLEELEKND